MYLIGKPFRATPVKDAALRAPWYPIGKPFRVTPVEDAARGANNVGSLRAVDPLSQTYTL